MRIGIYVSGINEKSGGAHTFEQNILNSLLKYKDNENIYIFSNVEDRRFINTKINYIKLKKEKKSIFPYSLVKRFSKKTKSYQVSPLDSAVKLYKISILWYATQYFQPIDIPYIYTVWDINHRIYPFFPEISVNKMWAFREELYRNVIPRASFLITGTETGKKEIMKFYNVPGERIKVLPFPVPKLELDSINHNYDLKKDFGIENKFLFYPGSFHPHKNHIRILESLVILEKKYNIKYTAIFVGNDCGNKNYIMNKCHEFGIQDRVKCLNFVSRDQLIFLYKNAFALVYASYFGPDNIPPLEAFSLKCPVISSRYIGAEEQLGKNAILIEPDKPEEFASAILKLKNDNKFREQIVNNAFRHVKTWSFEKYNEKVFSLIDSFAATRSCWGDKIDNYYYSQEEKINLLNKLNL